MPTAPYALVKCSVAGGATQTGGITATSGQSLQFSFDATASLGARSYKYEITSYPAGFTEPSGWDTDDDAVYFYSGITPPVVTAPTLPLWGKLLVRGTINAGDAGISGNDTTDMVDESTAVQTKSTNNLEDIAFGETDQFDPASWVGVMRRNLRLLDDLFP